MTKGKILDKGIVLLSVIFISSFQVFAEDKRVNSADDSGFCEPSLALITYSAEHAATKLGFRYAMTYSEIYPKLVSIKKIEGKWPSWIQKGLASYELEYQVKLVNRGVARIRFWVDVDLAENFPIRLFGFDGEPVEISTLGFRFRSLPKEPKKQETANAR